jgi:hypothetical protein
MGYNQEPTYRGVSTFERGVRSNFRFLRRFALQGMMFLGVLGVAGCEEMFTYDVGRRGHVFCIRPLQDGTGFVAAVTERILWFKYGQTSPYAQYAFDGTCINSVSSPRDDGSVIAADANGRLHVVRQNADTIRSVDAWEPPYTSDNRRRMEVATNGDVTIIADPKRGLVLWDLDRMACTDVLGEAGHPDRWTAVSSGDNGDYVTARDTGAGVQCIWNRRDSAPRRVVHTGAHTPFMSDIANDGKFLLTTGDGEVRVWNTEKDALHCVLCKSDRAKTAIAISADGAYAAAGGWRDLVVWRVTDCERLARIETPRGLTVTAIAFAQNPPRIIYGLGNPHKPVLFDHPPSRIHALTLKGSEKPGDASR